MGSKSGDKGKSYELRIAKLLTKWAGFQLIRTPMSGAWQGTAGDIKPKSQTDHFPFTVECKKDEGWDMDAVVSGKSALFKSWIDQLIREVREDEIVTGQLRFPLLIFSRNYRSDYILVPETNLDLLSPILLGDFTTVVNLLYHKRQFAITLLDEFLDLHYPSVADYADRFVTHFSYQSYLSLSDDI